MKKILLSTLVSSLLFTSLVTADSSTSLSSKEVSLQATKTATEDAQNHQVDLVKEALQSLALSAKAIEQIDNKQIDEAKKKCRGGVRKIGVYFSI